MSDKLKPCPSGMPDKKITFEEYLQEQHSNQCIRYRDMTGDSFNKWLQNLTVDEWIEFGDNYVKEGLL